MAKTDFKNVDQYISTFTEPEQLVLKKIRQAINKAVPEAEEVVSYQIPAFKYHGFIGYFSAFTNHYSLAIPPSIGVFEKFTKELKPYKLSKSTVQFQKSEPIPYDLIGKMVTYAAEQNTNKVKSSKK